jgi:outer membrane protein assembly factor BamB
MRLWITPVAATLALSTLSLSTVAAADYAQFRGPAGDGVSQATSLPATWDETTNVAWKTPIPGKGWSSPVLHQGRLYLTTAVETTTADKGELSLRALALDAASGLIVWDREIFRQPADSPKIHSKNSHASPTPIVDRSRLFVHFGHQGTACLDLDGNIQWTNSDLKYPPVHGNGGSPIIAGDHLIFTCDGGSDPFVVALDVASGREKWRFRRPFDPAKKFAFSTPTLITDKRGRSQVICPGAGSTSALDPETGREIWRCQHGGYSVIPKPLYSHGLVIFSTSYDSPEVIAVRPEGDGDITETHVEWSLKKGAPHTPSLVVVGNELYMVADKGVATCVDAATGKQHWQERLGGNFSSSLVYADGKLYVQSEEGPTTVIRPGRTFDKLATTGFDERTLASYAVGDRELYIRTEANLYRVEAR